MTKLIRGISGLFFHRMPNCVATIGNFDGLHWGHQKLLTLLKERAKTLNLPTAVILFEPQPNEFFAKNNPPARLMRFREKLVGLQKFDIDYVICLKFNYGLAELSAQDFVKNILVNLIHIREIIIGDDFHFGHKRQGDIHLLQYLGQNYHFTAQAIDTFHANEERVSSTRIRQTLQEGELKTAERLLGKPYILSGHVVHGDKRGRQIGFPTLNILLHRKASPLRGVFVVKVHGILSQPIEGVANIGKRPTIGGSRETLEVFLFDFNQNIYGSYLEVEFIHKLRDEKRFESFEELKEQIQWDVKEAREYFFNN